MTDDARARIRQSATARQHAASAPDTSAVALASAGSGKTRVLIGRAKRLLLAGAAPDGLLCLTFTKAAAAEMANRLRRDLAEWATADDAALSASLEATIGEPPDEAITAKARSLFPRALEAPGGVKIQTVHAFCQSLLARFPIDRSRRAAGLPGARRPGRGGGGRRRVSRDRARPGLGRRRQPVGGGGRSEAARRGR